MLMSPSHLSTGIPWRTLRSRLLFTVSPLLRNPPRVNLTWAVHTCHLVIVTLQICTRPHLQPPPTTSTRTGSPTPTWSLRTRHQLQHLHPLSPFRSPLLKLKLRHRRNRHNTIRSPSSHIVTALPSIALPSSRTLRPCHLRRPTRHCNRSRARSRHMRTQP